MSPRARANSKPCPSLKRRYPDHQSAARAVYNTQKAGPRMGKTIKRCYECPLCKGWHLTSKDG